MGNLEDSLIAGETVAYRGCQHWVVVFWPVVTAVLIGIAGVAMIAVAESSKQSDLGWLAIVGGVTLCIAAIFPLPAIWRRKAIELVVTNRRIIIRRGVLERRTEEVLLHKVESVAVDQGVWGRMLGYGTVAVRGTGGTLEPFPYMPRALELRRQVQQQIAGTP